MPAKRNAKQTQDQARQTSDSESYKAFAERCAKTRRVLGLSSTAPAPIEPSLREGRTRTITITRRQAEAIFGIQYVD